jgi:hypothetical protein
MGFLPLLPVTVRVKFDLTQTWMSPDGFLRDLAGLCQVLRLFMAGRTSEQ